MEKTSALSQAQIVKYNDKLLFLLQLILIEEDSLKDLISSKSTIAFIGFYFSIMCLLFGVFIIPFSAMLEKFTLLGVSVAALAFFYFQLNAIKKSLLCYLNNLLSREVETFNETADVLTDEDFNKLNQSLKIAPSTKKLVEKLIERANKHSIFKSNLTLSAQFLSIFKKEIKQIQKEFTIER